MRDEVFDVVDTCDKTSIVCLWAIAQTKWIDLIDAIGFGHSVLLNVVCIFC